MELGPEAWLRLRMNLKSLTPCQGSTDQVPTEIEDTNLPTILLIGDMHAMMCLTQQVKLILD